jgi:hypothetical protein
VLKGTLIEPARTNLLQRSEEFDNAYWGKNSLNTTGTPPWVNVAVAPDGEQTAEKLIPNDTNSTHTLRRIVSVTEGNTYTYSIFAKKSEFSNLILNRVLASGTIPNSTVRYDLINATVTVTTGENIGKIEDYGNGWYRCIVTFVATGTGATDGIAVYVVNNSSLSTFVGDNTSGIFIWGAQFEVGSVATSYIRTTDTAITQPADVISATGVSGLIGQTEGTVLVEVDLRAGKSNTARIITVADNNYVNGFLLNQRTQNDFEVIFRVNNVNLSTRIFSGNIVTGKYRIGIKYQLGESFNLFFNGSKLADGNVFSGFSSPLDRFYLGTRQEGDVQLNDTIPQALILKQALTDNEVQTWTTL